MFDTFVGIVSGNTDRGESNSISICIMDVSRQELFMRSFQLEKAHIDSYLTYSPNKKYNVNYTTDMHAIGDFLDSKIRDPTRVKVLIELPRIYPLDPANDKFEPVALVNADSIYLKVLTLLSWKHYISWLHSEVIENNTITLFSYIPEYKPEDARRLPKYLNENVSKIFGDFLLDSWDADKYSSIIAALIAKNIGVYYYWSSFGIVQSPQDIAFYLKTNQQTPTEVISAKESYMISIHESTKLNDLEKISLEYAITCKKYEYIGENNAIKAHSASGVQIMERRTKLYSFRNDAEEVDKKLGYSAPNSWEEQLDRYEWIKNARRVYPYVNDDLWIIRRIQQKQL